MNRKNRHIKNLSDPEDLSVLFFSRADIHWEKSKDEIWRDLSVRLKEENQNQNEVRRINPGMRWLAIAASLVLLLTVTGFMRFYQKETSCPPGQHVSLVLPDGSSVELNAQTSVRYHPLWWVISREVYLEGEAFFDVKKGKQFRVVSSLAATDVLGTTFNIYARDLNYRVTCLSGRVRVTSTRTNEEITLSPNERGDLDQSGVFNIVSVSRELSTPGWMNNLIMFASTPLRLVFDEIERQYGIVIVSPSEMDQVYSGNFSLSEPVDKVLYLLCRPFDLKYEQYTGKKYIVYPARME
jgi:transmembrane sensor